MAPPGNEDAVPAARPGIGRSPAGGIFRGDMQDGLHARAWWRLPYLGFPPLRVTARARAAWLTLRAVLDPGRWGVCHIGGFPLFRERLGQLGGGGLVAAARRCPCHFLCSRSRWCCHCPGLLTGAGAGKRAPSRLLNESPRVRTAGVGLPGQRSRKPGLESPCVRRMWRCSIPAVCRVAVHM